MEDPRSFATHVVGAAIAILGLGLLVAGGALAFGGESVFLGVIVGVFGLVVLVAAGAFLLVPFAVDELAETQSVRPKDP